MGHSLLDTFNHDSLFGELDMETFLGAKTSDKIDQTMANARKIVSDYRSTAKSKADDIQWIEMANHRGTSNTEQGEWDDNGWIVVNQNVTQGKRGDVQWIEVTHNITQGKYTDVQWIEVPKQTSAKVKIMQISYLIALTTIGFTIGFSLFS